MSKKLLWIIISLVAVIILFVVLKSSGALGKEEGIAVSTEKVTRRTIIETVTASGKVYPEIEVKVSPDISGEIVDLTVKEGDSVKRGQVLAKIYADIYSTQRDQAAAEVTRAQATAANTTAALEGLKANLDQAQANYNRQKKLLADKVISPSEFESAESVLRSAQANYNAALQTIRSSQASVQSAMANLESASKNVGRATIVAPMEGVVSLLAVKEGERVVGTAQMAGTEMMRIADMNVMEVRVDVGENDIPKVHIGDSALIEVDAYNNRKFKGIVTQIASSSKGTAGAAATANDVTNYEVRIRLLRESYQDLIDPKRPRAFPFRPGMNASADIQTKRHVNVIAVPINAVTTREKGTDKAVNSERSSFDAKPAENADANANTNANASRSDDLEEVVYVLQPDSKVKKVVVKTDIQDINHIEITSGLKEGDEVVTGPYTTVSKTLKDGTRVKVTPKDKLFDKKP
ncbi:MAG TPA: efflux RND transporter periplasmic adaptor subunit [Chitinophagaceae bacterium]|nr:efflux RND transporter periplasmic adaptor subunit [Chitinophagaceae bacterium]